MLKSVLGKSNLICFWLTRPMLLLPGVPSVLLCSLCGGLGEECEDGDQDAGLWSSSQLSAY